MENDYIQEKALANNIDSVPLEALKFLIPKTEKGICKIKCNDGSHGTGFFCNIPDDWNTLKVLMTNNHVLKKEDRYINR